jgi:hypothetical protein
MSQEIAVNWTNKKDTAGKGVSWRASGGQGTLNTDTQIPSVTGAMQAMTWIAVGLPGARAAVWIIDTDTSSRESRLVGQVRARRVFGMHRVIGSLLRAKTGLERVVRLCQHFVRNDEVMANMFPQMRWQSRLGELAPGRLPDGGYRHP